MEVALGVLLDVGIYHYGGVLILVLVEVALGDCLSPNDVWVSNVVLILVLVEVALGGVS